MNASLRWCLAAAGLAVLVCFTGCSTILGRIVPGLVNWRYHAVNGVEITAEQAGFIVPRQTTKTEIAGHFGFGDLNKPAWQQPGGRALAYTWIEVREGDRGGKLYRPLPFYRKGDVLYDFSDNWSEARAICVVFDASDRVVRFRFFAAKDAVALAALYQQWAQADIPEPALTPFQRTFNGHVPRAKALRKICLEPASSTLMRQGDGCILNLWPFSKPTGPRTLLRSRLSLPASLASARFGVTSWLREFRFWMSTGDGLTSTRCA